MTESQQDLDASLSALGEDVGMLVSAVADNTAAVQALIEKISQNPAAPDFTNEVAAVADTDQKIKDAIAALTASNTAATDAPPAAPAA